MSKLKRPYAEALAVAEPLRDWLAPYCDKIELAGSLRRHKAQIGDIELVAIPKYLRDLFGNLSPDTELDHALRDTPIRVTKNGPKYKQMTIVHNDGPWQVDLFLATPDNWGLIFMLRTGSAEFSKRMVTPRTWGGLKPETITVDGGRVSRAGKALAVPEETDLFRLWEMDFVEPSART